jgi:hypothetical protein
LHFLLYFLLEQLRYSKIYTSKNWCWINSSLKSKNMKQTSSIYKPKHLPANLLGRCLGKGLAVTAALLFAFAPLVSSAQDYNNFSENGLPALPAQPQAPLAPKTPAWNIANFYMDREGRHARVCNRDDKNPDTAACDVRVVTDVNNNAKNFVAPSGYGPAQLRTGYGLSGLASSTKPTIIAIVDAYNDANIKNDLDVYSAQFGIPTLPNCPGAINSSSAACFKKTDQNGGTFYPIGNSGWDLEIALDVEAAHAVCQNCSVLLVEARSNSFNDLLTAEDRAATLGANVISNSWGGGEFSGETSYDSHFNKPGVAITFSSGDSGYGVEYPAASRYVTAVGGTSLTMNGLAYGGESAWSGAGSGCSLYEGKPVWQTDSGCAKRTVADVSADADPNTGAAVYDSVRYQGVSGWFQVGGTSLASPIIAATYALSGNTAGAANSLPYGLGNPTNLHDVTSGTNGLCGGSYLCTAKAGFDGPTGLGTPKGTGAF